MTSELRIEIELSITPRWVWTIAAAAFLALPLPAATGEQMSASSYPVPSGTHQALSVNRRADIASRGGRVILLAQNDVTNQAADAGALLIGPSPMDPTQDATNAGWVDLGFPATIFFPDDTFAPKFHVKGNMQVSGCILLGDTAKCFW